MQKNSTRRHSMQPRHRMVSIGGRQVRIDAASINGRDWTKHSGTTHDGVKVGSLQTVTIGDSTLLRSGKDEIVTNGAELEILAINTLKARGFQITPPTGTSATA